MSPGLLSRTHIHTNAFLDGWQAGHRNSFTGVRPSGGPGGGTTTKTHVHEPTPQWTNVRTTYDYLTTKLKEKKVKDDHGRETAADVTVEQKQAAIRYWIHRLIEDGDSIAGGGEPCDS